MQISRTVCAVSRFCPNAKRCLSELLISANNKSLYVIINACSDQSFTGGLQYNTEGQGLKKGYKVEFEIRTWDVVHLQKLNQCAKNNFPCFYWIIFLNYFYRLRIRNLV